MLGKTKKVTQVIELSDASKQALASIDNDIQVLVSLLQEVVANQRAVIAALSGEITQALPVAEEIEEVHSVDEAKEKSNRWRTRTRTKGAKGIVRDSPYRRRPRHEYVSWILDDILADGRWHTPVLIAEACAGDPDERRYLRKAIQRTMKELTDEGQLESRRSNVPGSMFDYRKVPK